MAEKSFEQRMIDDYNKLIEGLSEVVRMCVLANAQVYGMKFFEVRLEGEDKKYKGSVNIPLSILREMNVTSRLNGFKKVQAWLETDDGEEYVLDAMKRKYERQRRQYEKRLEEKTTK